MSRTLSARQVLEKKHKTISLTGEWGDCLGEIDRSGVVFMWGNSGNGKSGAAMSFAKALTKFGKVLYVPLEEGTSLSMQNMLRRYSMSDCGRKFQLSENETIESLDERLSKAKAPEFVFIDSFQYAQLSYKQYIAFKERHRNKLLVFVSHADGKQPAGRAARSVMYDAGLKIWVEGYKAFSKGRFFGSTGEIVIWPERAAKYWGQNLTQTQNDNQ